MFSIRKVSTVLVGLVASFAWLSTARAACMGVWELGGSWQFIQGDGLGWFHIRRIGTKLAGRASFDWRGHSEGDIEGTINGDNVSITVYWNLGQVGVYQGTVSPEGWIVGETHDLMNPGVRGQWRSRGQMLCTVTTPPSSAPPPAAPPKIGPIGKKKPQPPIGAPAAPAPQAPAPEAPAPQVPAPQTPEKPQNLASVVQDVDVYKTPGKGKPIGVLRKGSQVSLVEPCNDNWCHIKGTAVPGGEGWVYSGPDYRSLQF